MPDVLAVNVYGLVHNVEFAQGCQDARLKIGFINTVKLYQYLGKAGESLCADHVDESPLCFLNVHLQNHVVLAIVVVLLEEFVESL